MVSVVWPLVAYHTIAFVVRYYKAVLLMDQSRFMATGWPVPARRCWQCSKSLSDSFRRSLLEHIHDAQLCLQGYACM